MFGGLGNGLFSFLWFLFGLLCSLFALLRGALGLLFSVFYVVSILCFANWNLLLLEVGFGLISVCWFGFELMN